MKNLWKFAKQGVLSVGISLLVVGCGDTGPEEKRTSVDVPIGVNNSSLSGALSSSQLSSVGSSASSSAQGGAAEYTISVDKLEFTEGSDPEANKSFPVTFSFNKPLDDDALLTVKLAANFGTGVYPGRISPNGAISLKKGASKFSVQFESYVNNNPESTKTADWVIDAYVNGESKILPVDNNVVIHDDDKMANKEIITTAGKLIEWDLNGIEKQDTGDKYTVTQISGAEVAFEIHADKLRILVPAPNNYRGFSPFSADLGDLKFQIVSSQGESYELSLPFFESTRFKLVAADINHDDYVEESPSYSDYYLQGVTLASDGPHHLVSSSYGPPVVELSYLNSNIKISGDVYFRFKQLHKNQILGGVNAQVSNGGKKIEISSADWNKIKEQVGFKESGVHLEAIINLRDSSIESGPDSENYVGQNFILDINLRAADKVATVTIDNTVPDSAFESGNIFLVLRDNYADAPGDGVVIIKPISQRVTEFGHLYGSDFDVSIADLSGQYSGSTNIPFDDTGVMSKAVTIVASSNASPKQASVQKKSARLLATPTSKTGECWDDEGKYVVSVRSADKDKENKCFYTFQKDDFVYGEPNQKTQLIIQVSSLEWPSFSSAKTTDFDDLWSAKLTSNRDIGLVLDEKSVSVKKSHFGGINKYFVSNCLDFSQGVAPEIKVEFAATNKGDSQLATEVAAYVRECQQFSTVDFVASALGTLSNGFREFRFINPVERVANGDAGRMYLSIPKELPSTISTNNDQRKFNAYIDLVPSDVAVNASSVTIDSLTLSLLQPATGDTVVAELEEIAATSTKLNIADKAATDGSYARDFKRIAMDNYSLPDTITSPVTYNVYSGAIMIAATIKGKMDGVDFETEPSLMNVTVAKRGINKVSQFYPLYEVRTIKSGNHAATHYAPQDASRWDWRSNDIAVPGGSRYGTRDDGLAGDGWILPELWRNLIADSLPATSLPGVTCTVPVPPLTTGHCDGDVGDHNDFADELRLGDASAFNSRCKATVSIGSGTPNEDWSRCRAITGHSSHHNGRAWDIRYLMPNGTVQDGEYSGQGETHFYNRWCAYHSAGTPAARTAIRQELRKFALRNRNFIEWIQSSMAATSTPFIGAYMGNNLKTVAGNSVPVLASCGTGQRPPTIRDFIVNGTLPAMPAVPATPTTPATLATPADNNTPADESDDNLALWSLGSLIKGAVDHDHHIHLDFDYTPVVVNR